MNNSVEENVSVVGHDRIDEGMIRIENNRLWLVQAGRQKSDLHSSCSSSLTSLLVGLKYG